MPRQWSPYHLRLDWMMWFLAISPAYAQPWLIRLCHGLLTNEPSIIRLLRTNPFPDTPPVHVRATLYRYRYSTAQNSGQSTSGGSVSASASTSRRYPSTRRAI